MLIRRYTLDMSNPFQRPIRACSSCILKRSLGCRGRKVMIVVGAGRGAAISRWRRATAGAPGWVVHAWEADPACFPALRSLARTFGSRSKGGGNQRGGEDNGSSGGSRMTGGKMTGGSMTVHPFAAWTSKALVPLFLVPS